MQRSSVDLPLPDGPQMTMRSPRATFRSISRSTWNSPNHLFKAVISTATSARGVSARGSSGRLSINAPSVPAAANHSHFHPPRVARHAIAEHEVEQRGKGSAGNAGVQRRPFRIAARSFNRAQKIENADDEDESRVLEQSDK